MPWTKPREQILRAAMYLSFLGSGSAALFIPSSVIETEIGWARWVWACFLIIGGLSSLFSSLTGVWVGEYAGIPLILTAVGTYAGALLASSGGSPGQITVGLLQTAIAFGLAARWRDIRILSHPPERKRRDQKGQ